MKNIIVLLTPNAYSVISSEELIKIDRNPVKFMLLNDIDSDKTYDNILHNFNNFGCKEPTCIFVKCTVDVVQFMFSNNIPYILYCKDTDRYNRDRMINMAITHCSHVIFNVGSPYAYFTRTADMAFLLKKIYDTLKYAYGINCMVPSSRIDFKTNIIFINHSLPTILGLKIFYQDMIAITLSDLALNSNMSLFGLICKQVGENRNTKFIFIEDSIDWNLYQDFLKDGYFGYRISTDTYRNQSNGKSRDIVRACSLDNPYTKIATILEDISQIFTSDFEKELSKLRMQWIFNSERFIPSLE